MIKTKAAIEVKIGDRTFEFYCEPHYSLGEVYDALTQMRSLVLERLKDIDEKEKAEQQKNSSDTKE